MKKLLLLCLILISLNSGNAQTLTSPVAEGVYGGRVHAITSYALNSDSTRIIISTESANTLFYSDIKSTNVGSTTSLGNFNPVPGADMDDGFGANINKLSSHELSGYVFFIDGSNIYRVHPGGGTAQGLTLVGNASQIAIIDNYFYAVEGGNLHFGTLNASGVLTLDAASPITISSSGLTAPPTIEIDKVTQQIWIFIEGANPELYLSSDTYNALNSSSSFTNISLSGMIKSGVDYRAFGSAPDGLLYIMGNHYPSGSNVSDFFDVAVSEDSATSWYHYNKPFSGPFVQIAGPNIAFAGTASNYYMYNGDSWNDNNGDSTSWNYFGTPGGLHHNNRANSGAVLVDPNNDSIVFFTTNVAFGYSSDYGSTAYGFNKGLTAVQVYDMEMTSDYNTGWLASKSGIRKVSNYKSSPVWSNTQFPNGDGSPYFSIAMAGDDTNTVYAGNVRIKKTTDGGANWVQQFDPTAPSGGSIYPPHGVVCETIEVNPWNPSIVLAGFASDLSINGGLFLTTDGGANWSQILVESSSPGSDVDVHDVLFTDSTTAYLGVFYDLSTPQGKSIYTLTDIGGSNTVAQNMDGTNTVVGYQIVASIYDLELSPTGDTIFAAGTDAGINHPICYFKDLSGTNKWEVISTSGFPSGNNDIASAVTIGENVVFCAVNSDIYTYDLSIGGSWSIGYQYPVGTQINFLFYDELLVGTGTGLYAHYLSPNFGFEEEKLNKASEIAHIFPNPVHDYMNIVLKSESNRIGELNHMDINGRGIPVVVSKQDGTSTLLNVKHLKAGTYILDIKINRQYYRYTFIKQ